jgi:hypothetical protein
MRTRCHFRFHFRSVGDQMVGPEASCLFFFLVLANQDLRCVRPPCVLTQNCGPGTSPFTLGFLGPSVSFERPRAAFRDRVPSADGRLGGPVAALQFLGGFIIYQDLGGGGPPCVWVLVLAFLLLVLLLFFLDGTMIHAVGGVSSARGNCRGASREHSLPNAHFPLELRLAIPSPCPSVEHCLLQFFGAVELDRVETFHGALERWLEALACFEGGEVSLEELPKTVPVGSSFHSPCCGCFDYPEGQLEHFQSDVHLAFLDIFPLGAFLGDASLVVPSLRRRRGVLELVGELEVFLFRPVVVPFLFSGFTFLVHFHRYWFLDVFLIL